MERVAVIIAQWNNRHLLEQCLASLAKQTYTALDVIVVDNGSTDDSVAFVREHYPAIHLITLQSNTGFAHPNNLGMHHALQNQETQYVLALNNDIILEPNFVEEMVACAKRHEDAGAIQGRLNRLNGLIDCTGMLITKDMSAVNRGQVQEDIGQFMQEEEIFGASASAALYTRTALETVQFPNGDFFDDDYFAYYEDVDLAWRIRLAGFTSWFTPHARALHHHSATGKSHSPFKAFHIHRNHFYNIIKNLPWPFMLRALALIPLRYVLLVSSVVLKKGPSAELSKQTSQRTEMMRIVIRSWAHVLIQLPSLLQKRRSIQRTRTVTWRTIARWFRAYPTSLKSVIYGTE
jgi:GT2 family glycosyltransferase